MIRIHKQLESDGRISRWFRSSRRLREQVIPQSHVRGWSRDSRGPRLRVGSRCARGGYRAENQDKCYADSERGIFLVADGIAGSSGGSEASSIVLQELPSRIQTALEDARYGAASPRVIEEAVESARDRMRRFARTRPGFARMGATMSLAWVQGDQAYVTAIGDCRVYVARDGRLVQLTSDQTFVQGLIDAGLLTPKDAATSPYRHVVTNSISAQASDEPVRVTAVPFQPGDRLLLATDGLFSSLAEIDIAEIITDGCPQQVADRLVFEALRRGSRDNIACVVVKRNPTVLSARREA